LDGLQHGNVPDSVRIELLALLGQWGWDHHDLGAFIDQINAEHADMWGEGPLLSPDDKQRILDWAAANEHDAPGLAAAKDKFDQQQQDARQREQEAAARRAAEADARRRAELARREAEDARRRSAEAAAQAERDRIRRLSGQDVLDQAADNARNAHDDFDCGARDGLWDMGQNVDGRIDQHFQDQIQAGMDVDDAVAAAQNARADAHDELNALNDLFGEIVDAAMDLAAQCDDAQQQAADQNDKQNNLDNAAQIDKATQRIQAMRNEFNQRMNALYSRYSSSNTAATNNGQQQINSQIGSH